MKIFGFTCTYNEEDYIPYVMPYVEAFGYDKFFVYDNGSTDSTVELLKKYPFVEVYNWDTGGMFNDHAKSMLQQESFKWAKEYANEHKEEVWFTFTDFDEVLFYNGDVSIKKTLEEDREWRNYNCFYKNMVNIFQPAKYNNIYDGDEENPWLKAWTQFLPNKFPHSHEGIRASMWVGGMKPTLICVNDFKELTALPGNHYAFIKLEEGKKIKNYDDCCRLYGFHLKFIDKMALKKKWEGYAARGKEVYVENLKKFDEIYEAQYSVSFPLEDYFLADAVRSKLWTGDLPYHGLIPQGF